MLPPDRHRIGVLGGVGPIASAEFLATIYDVTVGEREQDAPDMLLFSEPSFPDRTTVLLQGTEGELMARLERTCRDMVALDCRQIVLCCVTIHLLVPRLEPALRERIASLIDLTVDELGRFDGRALMLCSNASRTLGIFEQHERWPSVADRVVFPDADDQRLVHDELIYQLKRGVSPADRLALVSDLLARYRADAFVAGCTEFHLVTRLMRAGTALAGYRFVDPLMTFASALSGA